MINGTLVGRPRFRPARSRSRRRLSGDTRLIRLGYITSAVLWMGATLPGWAAFMLDPAAGANVTAQYGRPADEVLDGWVALTESLMDRADEARELMASLFG